MTQLDPATHLVRSREEWLNTLTHGLGAVASVAACTVLITFTALHGNTWQIVGACV